MANIKHLQMWKDICTDARIGINTSLFGLRTTAVYQPTNSVLDGRTVEFSPTDGHRLSRILDSPRGELAKAARDFHPQQTVNGNYLAELCISRDEAFVCVRLYQYVNMSYQPATDILFFEGEEARIVKQLF